MEEDKVPIGDLDITVIAPGKIILSGEHSVVYPGCPAIATSINKFCRCRLNTVEEKFITLELESLNYTYRISLDNFNGLELKGLKENLTQFIVINSERNAPEIKNAITVILFLLRVAVLYTTHHPAIVNTGLVLTIRSDLVLGAGSGSSAAFAVSVAGAAYYLGTWIEQCSLVTTGRYPHTCPEEEVYSRLEDALGRGDEANARLDTRTGREATANESLRVMPRLRRNHNLEWDKIELDTINFFAYQAERITHGKPSGLDNTICTFGGLVTMKKTAAGGIEMDKMADIFPLEILLIDTGVSRSTATLVRKVAELKSRHEDLFSTLLKSFTSVTEAFTGTMLSMSGGDHVEEKFKKLEDLIVMNQGLLASLGVSHPKLNQIIDTCSSHGLSAKLTGAGGGGFAFALVPQGYIEKDLAACIRELEDKGFKVTSGVKLGGVGVTMETHTRVYKKLCK